MLGLAEHDPLALKTTVRKHRPAPGRPKPATAPSGGGEGAQRQAWGPGPAPGRPKPAMAPSGGGEGAQRQAWGPKVWLFDLDDTLHDAGHAAMPGLQQAMNDYIRTTLGLDPEAAASLRRHYWLRYGATLLGLVRHHGVKPAHFLHHTHLLPGLEERLRARRPDLHALARLPGRKYLLTNAPRAYALRVLDALGATALFDGLIAVEDMQMFGQLRPKPDARMLRRTLARLRVAACRCILVEDTLAHQKAARRVGLHTAWMQRWLPPAGARHRPLKPAYVDRRIHHLATLLRRAP